MNWETLHITLTTWINVTCSYTHISTGSKKNNGPVTDVNEVSDVTMFCETEVILNSSFLIIKMAANSTDLLCGKYYSQLKVTLSPESLLEMRMQNTTGTVISTPYSGLSLTGTLTVCKLRQYLTLTDTVHMIWHEFVVKIPFQGSSLHRCCDLELMYNSHTQFELSFIPLSVVFFFSHTLPNGSSTQSSAFTNQQMY